MFLPGEVMKVVTVLVNGETVIEPDETLLVNLTAPTNATLFDAQGVGTITDDDAVIVDEATVTQAVSDGSGRVEALQQPDGGWFFQVGDTDCGAGPGVSCTNTVGITGLGLLAGYTRTGTEAFLDAATAAGDYLVARYNATIGAVPPVLPASQDVEFLVELELLGGDPLYSTTADDWFQRLVTAYPDAADRVDFLLADRGGLRTVALLVGTWRRWFAQPRPWATCRTRTRPPPRLSRSSHSGRTSIRRIGSINVRTLTAAGRRTIPSRSTTRCSRWGRS